MEHYCENHYDLTASDRCRSCGKHFCKDCLSEGTEYSYCANTQCQARMIKDEALIEERNRHVEGHFEQIAKTFDVKVFRILLVVWLIVTPIFIFIGSDQWTRNFALASSMGPLGSLVFCIQLKALLGLYKRRFLENRIVKLIDEWEQREVENI